MITPLIGLFFSKIPIKAFRSAGVIAGSGSFSGRVYSRPAEGLPNRREKSEVGWGANAGNGAVGGTADGNDDNGVVGTGVREGKGGGMGVSGSTKLSSKSGSGQANSKKRM